MRWWLQTMARAVERRPGITLTFLAVMTVVLGGFAAGQTTDTELTSFAPDSELADAFDRIQEDFATGGARVQVVVDAGPGGNVLDPAGIEAAEQVEAVVRASDTPLADGPRGVASFAAAVQADGVSPAAASLLSRDLDPATATARAGLVVVELDPALPDADAQEATLELAEQLEVVDVAGIDVDPFGTAILSDALQAESEDEMPRLLSLSLFLIVAILFLQFRTVSDVVLGFVGLIVTITWMFGFAVVLGPDNLGLVGNFTQISTIVPVLLIGLGIDYAIHLTSRYREEQRHGLTPPDAAAMAVRTVGGALVLATLTTVVGFLTNLVSPLPPIADFGVFTAVGVTSALVVMTLLVPSARRLLDDRPRALARATRRRRRERSGTNGLAAFMGRTAAVAERAPRLTLAIALVVTVVAGGAGSQIETSFSQDDFVPADSEPGMLIDKLDTLFGGDLSESTFVLIDGDVTDAELAGAIAEAPELLAGVEDVRAQGGAAQVSRLPDTGPDVAALMIATTAGQDRAEALAGDLDAALAPIRDAGGSTTVVSESLVLDETLDALTASQTQGIAITLLGALTLLIAYFGVVERKPLLGAITMVPSIAVVGWVLGTMVLLDISFNVLTAMVASLAIGIGVPFGIHVTHRFMEDRRRYDTIDEAIRQTVTHTGGAMAGSAATTAAGFGVLAFASLLPMQQFGIIVAVTIVYSLLASVLIQPSCLKLWGEWRVRRGEQAELHEHEERRVLEPVG
ncbi:MAG TPA: hypothetical protein DCS55_07290 [Acidimicrobiaceae bacterium]|nr:hypothetical protein [Acidimicrobiaceae bacterium]